MEKIISCDDLVALREDELLKLEDEQKKLSTAEIEGRMRSELEHLRDMTKVCARRLHLESCSLLRPDDKTFSLEKVCSCFDRILEFDPRLFNNFRAQMFGVPSALIIPGNGNAMFDWKNNQFLIPLIPPQGDFMGSIATAVIEYRLDVDEEKEMTTSYQRVPENKNIKSIISLHQALTKDYIRWMTFEYSGFKVLSKNVRYWFEHEVAPKKNEIYCPPEYQVFAMKPEVFKAVSDEIEERVSQSGSSTPAADLWKAHVFAFQKGKYADAGRYLEMLNSKPHKYLFSWFNLGIINAKIGKGQEAKAAYTEFIKRSPHCWWTTVAAEHLRSLT
jgi:tetratricopeptide (TPR) repeat protein